jgi:hypothetical protein
MAEIPRAAGHRSVSFCTSLGFRQFQESLLECAAGTAGLELATSAVIATHADISFVTRAVPAYLAVGGPGDSISPAFGLH